MVWIGVKRYLDRSRCKDLFFAWSGTCSGDDKFSETRLPPGGNIEEGGDHLCRFRFRLESGGKNL